jgi:hypothetical protein
MAAHFIIENPDTRRKTNVDACLRSLEYLK